MNKKKERRHWTEKETTDFIEHFKAGFTRNELSKYFRCNYNQICYHIVTLRSKDLIGKSPNYKGNLRDDGLPKAFMEGIKEVKNNIKGVEKDKEIETLKEELKTLKAILKLYSIPLPQQV